MNIFIIFVPGVSGAPLGPPGSVPARENELGLRGWLSFAQLKSAKPIVAGSILIFYIEKIIRSLELYYNLQVLGAALTPIYLFICIKKKEKEKRHEQYGKGNRSHLIHILSEQSSSY